MIDLVNYLTRITVPASDWRYFHLATCLTFKGTGFQPRFLDLFTAKACDDKSQLHSAWAIGANTKFSGWPKWCHFTSVWLTELHSLSRDISLGFTSLLSLTSAEDWAHTQTFISSQNLLDQISPLNMLIKHAESSPGRCPETKWFASWYEKAALILLIVLRAFFHCSVLEKQNRKCSGKCKNVNSLRVSNFLMRIFYDKQVPKCCAVWDWALTVLFGNVWAKSFYPG